MHLRPQEEARLRNFLLQRIESKPGMPKALLLCGPPGVGKRTLLRRVFESDPRLRAYQFADPATRELLTDGAHPGSQISLLGDVAAAVLGVPHAVVGALAGVANALLKHRLAAARTPETARDPFLEGTRQPLLLVVGGFDPHDTDALGHLGRRINQARDQALPRALVILDDTAPLQAEEPGGGPGASLGLVRLREYLADNRRLEILFIRPLTAAQCRDAFVQLGLSREWGRLLFHFSDGRIAALRALWEALTEGGLIVAESGGRWKAVQPASISAAATLIHQRLLDVIEHRIPQGSPHTERLARACYLAASMGATFLPQAIAEVVAETDPKREEFDHRTWEDLWYHILEEDEGEAPGLAPQCMAEGSPLMVQGDQGGCFVHAFRDPAFVTLLRTAARQMRDEWTATTTGERPHDLFVAAGATLETWLARTFVETWPEALPFQGGLLRIRRQNREADLIEDKHYRFRVVKQLRLQAERERQRVRQGKVAGDLFVCLLWYGETLYELGAYEQATTILTEAKELADAGRVTLTLRERIDLQASLGHALEAQGAYSAAEPLMEDNLRLATTHLGDRHPLTLTSLSCLASVYDEQGRYKEAERLYAQALEGLERVLGHDHPHTLNSLGNLGKVYYNQGRYKEAGRLFARALEGEQRVLGPDHPHTLTSLSNLAGAYNSQGRFKEAEHLCVRALERLERVLRQDHPLTLTSLSSLASVYYSQGRYKEAERLYARALEGLERVLGHDHPKTVLVRGFFAQLLRMLLQTEDGTGGADPLA